ncbi:peptidase [Thalassotalea insulae]|uniref:Peptidase n=1 Tax=Thalassotalea insulae TaxID=2056778 RepID=A0ABQ6GVC9_9GAMM|nr:penicillin acylase family protein [Thalassotalea insulae]GLX79309.1 peptidase [Thalassotalea insulae]
MNNIKKISIAVSLIIFLLCAMALTWVYSQIDSALPILEGKQTILGIKNSVVIERDQQGIATIKGQDRLDIATATGFIHAQERFFQMDLLRKNAAGELSSLFGPAALDYDKSIRLHRFRQRAEQIVNHLPKAQQRLLTAYTTGVNEGLHSLKAQPFEYLLLQQEPVEWLEEDTVLTVLSMYLDLQYKDGGRERTLGVLASSFAPEIFAFLNPKGSRWDAAVDGTRYSAAPLPDMPWPAAHASVNKHTHSKQFSDTDDSSEQFPGSNNWAVGGNISATGSAIVANDMHLGLRVPNTWFRASFEYQDDNDELVKVSGLTLPGTPAMVTGSNGNIAWGFTNSYGDWSDVIIINTNEKGSHYLTPDGEKAFTQYKHVIAVKGQQPQEFISKETQWGPIIGKNADGKLLAYRWVAHDLEAVNFTAQQLEQATSVQQAFTVAAHSGIPAQNMMIGDKAGNIGWTIMGPIPKKSSNFGATPKSWANGRYFWDGYLTEDQYPRILNPATDRLWTANARVVGGQMQEKIGNGGYALGARAQQIRDALFAETHFDEKKLLAIALDDRALFLKPWQHFLLDKVLTTEAITNKPLWQQAKEILQTEHLSASVNSVSYRLVRNFRLNLRNQVFALFNKNLSQFGDNYDFHTIRHQIETPLWQLVNQQPDNFLWLTDSWQATFEQALNTTLVDMTQDQSLTEATWGQINSSEIQHPIAKAVPLLGKWLNMPKTQLPGDSYMPRVQGKAFGASERMVVSPGHEETGILHMPTSQAGHPWSPYYRSGHQDWEQGKPSPFLPGKTRYSLTLLSY